MRFFHVTVLLSFYVAQLFAQTDHHPTGNPLVLGSIHEIHSAILSEKRVVNIYIPENYKAEDTTKYAVIYLLDGSADEDFIHIAGLVQFYNFPWIDHFPPAILVGIVNVDRKRDFTFPSTLEEEKKRFSTSGHSSNFIAFIEKELQPYIERKFRTNTSKSIIGQSLGGLLVTEILIEKPALFNKYIIVSPSIWWSNGALIDKTSILLPGHFPQRTDIYIGVGKEGLTPTMIPRVMEVDANVLAENLKKLQSNDVNVYFDYLPQENHATILHQAVMNAFKWISNFAAAKE